MSKHGKVEYKDCGHTITWTASEEVLAEIRDLARYQQVIECPACRKARSKRSWEMLCAASEAEQ